MPSPKRLQSDIYKEKRNGNLNDRFGFKNRFDITLAADMYVPKGASGKLPAIAVSGPFGAVKEQASGLYAQRLAEMGYITIAFDPSYTGESGGTPRYSSSMDINTEDFCAAVLIVHGEKAHSRYFGEEAYKAVTSGKYGANKRLLIVPGATHCDLYDGGQGNFIPWQDIESFYKDNLRADK